MLSALFDAKVEFLVVGAYAMAGHGCPRATGDIDFWVRPSEENAKRVWNALLAFGAPMAEISIEDFAKPGIVFQIGVAPNRIDILTFISGVDFDTAWPNKITVTLEGISVPVIGREELLQNKRASGRPKDIVDVELLDRENEE